MPSIEIDERAYDRLIAEANSATLLLTRVIALLAGCELSALGPFHAALTADLQRARRHLERAALAREPERRLL